MDRRSFLKSIVPASVGALVVHNDLNAPTAVPGEKRVLLIEVDVAGFMYHRGMEAEVAATLRVGDDLAVLREPDNPHDPLALAIHTKNGEKLGYVPRWTNSIPAAIADQDVPLVAEILDFDPAVSPWVRLKIALYQVVKG